MAVLRYTCDEPLRYIDLCDRVVAVVFEPERPDVYAARARHRREAVAH